MNKEEFSKYISMNLGCSKEIAKSIITLFSESLSLAISEGETIELENLGSFKISNIPSSKVYSRGKIINRKARRQAYFVPAKDLKIACNY